jgi:hypothetical protein
MIQDPLLTTLLDLDSELKHPIKFIVCGGYGLYLKQLYLKENPQITTLLPYSSLPIARTTQDIDLVLHAEIATEASHMTLVRKALDILEFSVVETAKYMQFVKNVEGGKVKVDLLSAPLGELASKVPKDSRRVKSSTELKLHARKMEEALGIEKFPIQIPISGTLSTGTAIQTNILIPQAFSYILTKLFAFKDRLHDQNKNLGSHHALDLYRIVGMITKNEHTNIHQIALEYATHSVTESARNIIKEYFSQENDMGLIRLREHPLANDTLNLHLFTSEMASIFK